MQRADFYILDTGADPGRFACNLASKAWKQGHTLHILAPDRDAALGLDSLLWTFRDISFLPHAVLGDDETGAVPITIGWPETTLRQGDVLINLSTHSPEQAAGFARIAEIVPADDDLRRQARTRYRQYREQGFELHSHDLSNEQNHD